MKVIDNYKRAVENSNEAMKRLVRVKRDWTRVTS